MAISALPIQQQAAVSAAGTIAITLASQPTQGNTLVIFAGTSDTTVIFSNISQTGVTWQRAVSGSSSTRIVEIWYGNIGAGASTGITVNLSGTPASTYRGGISEWGGLLSSGALSVTGDNNGNSTTVTTASITPPVGYNVLLIASSRAGNTSVPTNGFTNLTTQDVSAPGSYLVVPSTSGSYSTGWTTVSGLWQAEIASFLAPPSPIINSYSENNKSSDGALDNTNQGFAQSFSASTSAILRNATFYLKKAASPTGNAVAKLYATSGAFGSASVPTGTALATSDNFDVATLKTTYQLIPFTFSGANQLTLNSQSNYCVSVEYSNGDAVNFVGIGNSNPGADPGNMAVLSSGTWTPFSTFDSVFYLYGDPFWVASLV